MTSLTCIKKWHSSSSFLPTQWSGWHGVESILSNLWQRAKVRFTGGSKSWKEQTGNGIYFVLSFSVELEFVGFSNHFDWALVVESGRARPCVGADKAAGSLKNKKNAPCEPGPFNGLLKTLWGNVSPAPFIYKQISSCIKFWPNPEHIETLAPLQEVNSLIWVCQQHSKV